MTLKCHSCQRMKSSLVSLSKTFMPYWRNRRRAPRQNRQPLFKAAINSRFCGSNWTRSEGPQPGYLVQSMQGIEKALDTSQSLLAPVGIDSRQSHALDGTDQGKDPQNKLKVKTYTFECGFCGEKFTSHSHTARYCPHPKPYREYAYRERKRSR